MKLLGRIGLYMMAAGAALVLAHAGKNLYDDIVDKRIQLGLNPALKNLYNHVAYPVRPVGKYSTLHIMPRYRIDVKTEFPEAVAGMLSALENVPDAIQERVNKAGGTAVLCDVLPSHYLTKEEIESYFDEIKSMLQIKENVPFEDKKKFISGFLGSASGVYCCTNTAIWPTTFLAGHRNRGNFFLFLTRHSLGQTTRLNTRLD